MRKESVHITGGDTAGSNGQKGGPSTPQQHRPQGPALMGRGETGLANTLATPTFLLLGGPLAWLLHTQVVPFS